MHLFKTEMLFLQPPRTRFAYGRHAPRLQRYGRRATTRDDAAPADASARVEPVATASTAAAVVDRAA